MKDEVWKSQDLTKNYLKGVRGALPLAAEQIDLMLRLVDAACPNLERFLDLGCGDGILGYAIMERFPNAEGVFLDFSEPMIEAAQERLASHLDQAIFIVQDYGDPLWLESVGAEAPFDLIVSGFSIHHQTDKRKRAIYGEIFNLLKPDGLFLNLEHVSSPTKWVEERFDELMIEAIYTFHRKQGGRKTRDEVAHTYYYRPDKDANLLAPLEIQCDWLREIGFTHVDCYLKILELALFGGIRPSAPSGARAYPGLAEGNP